MRRNSVSIHLFRRDLRLYDNTSLNEALKNSETVIPVFILDPNQFLNNQYFSANAFQFMIESLKDLDRELKKSGSKLTVLRGKPVKVLKQLFQETGAEKLYFNRDYTPFSIKRDKQLLEAFETNSFDDSLIHPPGSIMKKDGSPYTVFTPFYKMASNMPVMNPEHTFSGDFYKGNIDDVVDLDQFDSNSNPFYPGGRSTGLKELQRAGNLENYKIDRDYPSKNGTSRLSAHLKFGTLSVREVYQVFKSSGPELLRELYWRDFFTHIAFFFPHVFGNSFRKQYDELAWKNDIDQFTAWCAGKTGFPIVDAGMRELNSTGFMHNRVRMITASFLVKDLHIDWRWGERYFAQNLVDYDPAVNNGNWQWAASTGCDAQPFFRIFNPWRQQARFDPKCEYIKKWIPELSEYSPQEIHKHENNHLSNYSTPIIEHGTESKLSLAIFKAVGKSIN